MIISKNRMLIGIKMNEEIEANVQTHEYLEGWVNERWGLSQKVKKQNRASIRNAIELEESTLSISLRRVFSEIEKEENFSLGQNGEDGQVKEERRAGYRKTFWVTNVYQ